MTSRPFNRIATVVVLGGVWLFGIAAGLRALYTYDATPGAPAKAPVRWPSKSEVRIMAGRPTLVVFAHPRCPCSRASIGNLSEIMARNPGKLSAYVVFSLPVHPDAAWTGSDTYRAARRIQGLTVVADPGGTECKRFGAKTSGQTMLYDSGGRLCFSGGITAGRSHYGDNAGSDSIDAVLAGRRPAFHSTPVFGCALVE